MSRNEDFPRAARQIWSKSKLNFYRRKVRAKKKSANGCSIRLLRKNSTNFVSFVNKRLLNVFQYMPEAFRIGSDPMKKPIWKIFYPNRETNGKKFSEKSEQNGALINKEKASDNIDMIMLNKQVRAKRRISFRKKEIFYFVFFCFKANGKRKAKGNSEENLSSKAKAKRYRRPCDSDEFPSTMILDKDEEIDEQVKPFEYRPIDEEEILSRSSSRFFLQLSNRTKVLSFLFN